VGFFFCLGVGFGVWLCVVCVVGGVGFLGGVLGLVFFFFACVCVFLVFCFGWWFSFFGVVLGCIPPTLGLTFFALAKGPPHPPLMSCPDCASRVGLKIGSRGYRASRVFSLLSPFPV